MGDIPMHGLGRIAYERWREGTGIPLDFAWGRLPRLTQEVWEQVAQAVLEEGAGVTEWDATHADDTEEGSP